MNQVTLDFRGGPYDGRSFEFTVPEVFEGQDFFHNIIDGNNKPTGYYVHYRVSFKDDPHLAFISTHEGDYRVDPLYLLNDGRVEFGADVYTLSQWKSDRAQTEMTEEESRGMIGESGIIQGTWDPENWSINPSNVVRSTDHHEMPNDLPGLPQELIDSAFSNGIYQTQMDPTPRDHSQEVARNHLPFAGKTVTADMIHNRAVAIVAELGLTGAERDLLTRQWGLSWIYTVAQLTGELDEWTFYAVYNSRSVGDAISKKGFAVAQPGRPVSKQISVAWQSILNADQPNSNSVFGLFSQDGGVQFMHSIGLGCLVNWSLLFFVIPDLGCLENVIGRKVSRP